MTNMTAQINMTAYLPLCIQQNSRKQTTKWLQVPNNRKMTNLKKK